MHRSGDGRVVAGTTGSGHVEPPAHVMQSLEPVLETEPRPTPSDSDERWRYVRSYIGLRAAIGFMGLVLPVLMFLLDSRFFQESPDPRGSLSAYYYSGARDLFVGSLCITAAFLMTYKVVERNLDNTASIAAGFAALVVALFPTGRPADEIRLSPLQRVLTEEWVERIHFVAAGVFILTLGLVSVTFGIREGKRRDTEDTMSPRFWRSFHLTCAGVIAAAVAFIAFSKLVTGPANYLLIGEVAAVWAFGASWLMKGLELKVLAGPP